jgi:hypothetical protein
MRMFAAPAIVLTLAAMTGVPQQTQPPATQGASSDIYHVHFAKAVAGQAAALGKALMTPNPASPMPDHFVVLRHQEGDSWDYAVIQHMGQKATVELSTAAPTTATPVRAWHNDTFTAGPPWPEFMRAMGLGAEGSGRMVYVVSTQRAVPGHRDQLEKLLAQPPPSNAKIQTGNVLLPHLEGADWTFVAITRYNSWQDLATDRAEGAANPDSAGGWNEVRQHSDMHRDTIADRIYPVK